MMANNPYRHRSRLKDRPYRRHRSHLGNGQVIQNSVIAFDKGKLVIVTDASTRPDLTGYDEVKLPGNMFYHGFILPNSQVGLMEIRLHPRHGDNREHGDINPNVRALPGYNTDTGSGLHFVSMASCWQKLP